MGKGSLWGSLSTGTLTVVAAGCGVAVGLVDVAGLIVSKAIYGTPVDREQEGGELRHTDATSRVKGGAPSPSASMAGHTAVPSKGYLVPIMVAGSSGVGKTTLGRAYLIGEVPEQVQGDETLFRTQVVGDLKAHIQIWEKELLPGGDGSLAERRPVCGVLLVYSTQHPHTFQDVLAFHAFITSKEAGRGGVPVMAVLGNMLPPADGEKDQHSPKGVASLLQSVDLFAEEHGLPHFLMQAPDDAATAAAAFQEVVAAGLKHVVAKTKELRERRESQQG